ncbi:MAG: hypothetical protein R3223_07860 [Longimicrobiales bacterium]|nr:hypothetical protein [Longimicrobiales bacterium]
MGRYGFTLVEALVSLTLSTLLVALVTSVFVAQSDFYDDILRRSQVHADARSVVDVVTGDVRAVTEGTAAEPTFLVANSTRMVIYQPLTVGFICDIQGSRVSTYLPRSRAGLDTLSVTGYALQDGDGSWNWSSDDWSGLYDSQGTTIKDDCGTIGMDTTGIPAAHFVSLDGPGSSATVGEPLMLHRTLDLRLATSGLDPSQIGLYRGTVFSSLVEVASGLGSNAGFSYRLEGQSSYSNTIASGDRDDINAVRVTAHAADAGGGGLDPYEYTLVRDVPIKNERWP